MVKRFTSWICRNLHNSRGTGIIYQHGHIVLKLLKVRRVIILKGLIKNNVSASPSSFTLSSSTLSPSLTASRSSSTMVIRASSWRSNNLGLCQDQFSSTILLGGPGLQGTNEEVSPDTSRCWLVQTIKSGSYG